MKSENKVCSTCRHFRKFERPFQREDGAVIYGYCFKDAKNNYFPTSRKMSVAAAANTDIFSYVYYTCPACR